MRRKQKRRLRNDLYCVEWGVKLYSLTLRAMRLIISQLDKLYRLEYCTIKVIAT